MGMMNSKKARNDTNMVYLGHNEDYESPQGP